MTTRHLQLRYVIALFLIALLTIISQMVMQSSIADEEYDSRVVNIAGRQRMLSQKITKTCFVLAHAETAASREDSRQQLEQALALWQRSHAGLQRGDEDLGLPGHNSAAVTALFQTIEPHFQDIVAAVREILAAPEDPERLRQAIRRISGHEAEFLRGMDAIVFRYDREAKDKVGQTRRLELGLAALTLLLLALEARLIFAPALSRLRRHMEERDQRQEDMSKLFSASPTAIFLVDGESLAITRVNHKAESLMGCAAETLVQRPIGDFLDIHHETNRTFLQKIRNGDAFDECEVLLIDAQNSTVEALASACPITFHDRRVYAIGVTNISEMKKAQQTLQYYATFDEMTGLVNRRTGLLLLGKEVERARRSGTSFTVCYVDLDGLKTTNDRYGHQEGDWLIRTLSRVLAETIRKGDVAIRLGGDEFLLALHDCPEDEAGLLLQRIEKRMAEIPAREAKPFPLTASFGVATYDPLRHGKVDDLVAEADSRMYAAKQAKKSACQASGTGR